jgi:pimeloyl-ACP methyl ester carboxylesterase
MDVILVPGLWLTAESWAEVALTIATAGHRAHPLTLPGMDSPAADRSAITLDDHVAAVVHTIDAATGDVVLVAHSAGSGVAHAAVDARPDRVARAIYIGGFPTADGSTLVDGFTAVGGEVPPPDWSEFEDEDLADLDEPLRTRFLEQAIPTPEHVVTDKQRLTDERRFDVPVTAICTEYSSYALRGWIAEGLAPVKEFASIRDLTFVHPTARACPDHPRPAAARSDRHQTRVKTNGWRCRRCAQSTNGRAPGTRLIRALLIQSQIHDPDPELGSST